MLNCFPLEQDISLMVLRHVFDAVKKRLFIFAADNLLIQLVKCLDASVI